MTDRYTELVYGRRDLENRFSYWWEKVKNCGISVPKTMVFKVPHSVFKDWYGNGHAAYREWVREEVEPALTENGLVGPLFVKNAVFSNKFDAKYCFCNAWDISDAMNAINETAMEMIMGYCGEDELVVRERIPYDPRITPCIYHGLPLRPEFRIFYDFDTREVLYSCNYWEYDYVRPHLYDATDLIVFDHERAHIEEEFLHYREVVESMVHNAMREVKGLSGPWSIDIMLKVTPSSHIRPLWERKDFFLIDMAVAEQSAYWEFREERMQLHREQLQ